MMKINKKVFCHFLNAKKTLFLVLSSIIMFSPVEKGHFYTKNEVLTVKKQYVEFTKDKELKLIYK